MRGWLNGFDARVALTPLPVLAEGLLAPFIAVRTTTGRACRVAQTGPVRVLRHE